MSLLYCCYFMDIPELYENSGTYTEDISSLFTTDNIT